MANRGACYACHLQKGSTGNGSLNGTPQASLSVSHEEDPSPVYPSQRCYTHKRDFDDLPTWFMYYVILGGLWSIVKIHYETLIVHFFRV